MNFRKHMMLFVGCGIALLLAIAAAVGLFLKMSENGKAQSDLKATMTDLERLNKSQPYPSVENVVLTSNNLVVVQKALLGTQNRLRVGQVEPEQIESARFATLLERTTKQLREQAVVGAVALPEHFAFGFANYTAGDQPVSNAIPRLVTQLKTVAELCNILYAAKITNIVSIGRDEFESEMSPQGGSSAPNAPREVSRASPMGGSSVALFKDIPRVASNELYSVERFSLEFAGRENSIWEVFNALVKGPPFVVIRDVSLESVTTGQMTPPTAGGGGRTGAPSYSYESARPGSGGSSVTGVATNLAMRREDRVVSGREAVRATVVVDVYRFADGKGVAP